MFVPAQADRTFPDRAWKVAGLCAAAHEKQNEQDWNGDADQPKKHPAEGPIVCLAIIFEFHTILQIGSDGRAMLSGSAFHPQMKLAFSLVIACALPLCAEDLEPFAPRPLQLEQQALKPALFLQLIDSESLRLRIPQTRETFNSSVSHSLDAPGPGYRKQRALFRALAQQRVPPQFQRLPGHGPVFLTKEYKVAPSFFDSPTPTKEFTYEAFFKQHGIKFPVGASAEYEPATQRLTVRNWQEELDVVDAMICLPGSHYKDIQPLAPEKRCQMLEWYSSEQRQRRTIAFTPWHKRVQEISHAIAR